MTVSPGNLPEAREFSVDIFYKGIEGVSDLTLLILNYTNNPFEASNGMSISKVYLSELGFVAFLDNPPTTIPNYDFHLIFGCIESY